MSSAATSPQAATSPAVAAPSEDLTPGSSPPPTDENEDSNDNVSKNIQAEETRLQLARETSDLAQHNATADARRKEFEGADKKETDDKFKALEYLLSQSKLYSTIMLQQMERQEEQDEQKDERSRKKAIKREEKAEKAAEEGMRRATTRGASKKDEGSTRELPSRGKAKDASAATATKGSGKISNYFQKSQLEANVGKGSRNVADALEEAVADEEAEDAGKNQDGVKADSKGFDNLTSARQPDLVSGGTMRGYQLEGLEWLTSLYENGLNGILADEMGLGKTIQTIAFLAFLREKGTYGPFLVAAPLSTTTNWVEEFNRWTPEIPVVLYHGSKAEREQIRKKRLKGPGSATFPVVITSYEICMNDRKFLAGFGWKFIIIDEGHRIKNLNCRLIRELQTYQSANRLLITGTPLQNNLTELWSLLHFLMPTIFDSLQQFESWFDFSPALADRAGYETLLNEERKQKLVASLHAILKPFLLRRVKRDVEKLLPKKREYVLFAPLTPLQRELYESILDGTSREYLEKRATDVFMGRHSTKPLNAAATEVEKSTPKKTPTRKRKALAVEDALDAKSVKSTKSSRDSTPASSIRGRRSLGRGKKRTNYEEVSDTAYFKQVESGAATPATGASSEDDEADGMTKEEKLETEARKMAKRLISGKKLQNPVMQLRLCCDSPYNFYSPFQRPVTLSSSLSSSSEKTSAKPKASNNEEDEEEDDDEAGIYETELPPDESLITSSGKMLLLDSLLPSLFADNHKVLIFSQFKSQLDLLEQYATGLRSWGVCRIDGSVPQAERQAQITAFNAPAVIPASKPKKKTKSTRKSAAGAADDDDEKSEPAKNLFLLSTRAGGQGINLAAADTVILFDSDWNPQQDAQAQDRAHRIGQTRNVIVYRFATRGTVEEMLLGKAEGKRRLEKLVIRKSRKEEKDEKEELKAREAKQDAKMDDGNGNGNGADEELHELRKMLLETDDGTRVDLDRKPDRHGRGADADAGEGVLSAKDIAVLTDRSDAAYEPGHGIKGEMGLGRDGSGGAESGAFRALEAGEDGLLEGLKR